MTRRLRQRLLPLALLLLAGCTTYPTPDPRESDLDPLEWSYWSEAQTDIPTDIVGLWRPVQQTGEDVDWFVLSERGIFRRIRRGRVLLEEGGLRRKGDVLYLHRQRTRGDKDIAPNFFRFRYEWTRDARDRLKLVFLASSERGNPSDDEYLPRVHDLRRADELPEGAEDEPWASDLLRGR